ncbi:hypothetical protein C0Q70_18572 [Pomacea canaliculata]|uniref:Reverse transcriptase/retrotransposon-derived protein RNase H-like domain-containing protein n=1 Tax=Pomacea canaliculata TaxID=400727 RepID=A0A2T7NGV9_POMCA|nr:hypothetical protein C0Q70_18572 [Pomacea canaliculata]
MPVSQKKKTGRKTADKSQQAKWRWGQEEEEEEEEEEAFQTLKDFLKSPPILGYPDYKLPFELHVDASALGRGLNKAEKNYPAHKLEFLALKWAVTEKFHDYLYGQKFSTRRNRTSLASYNFDIRCRPGSSSADADALSRLQEHHIEAESVRATCDAVQPVAYVECLSLSMRVVDENFTPPRDVGSSIRDVQVPDVFDDHDTLDVATQEEEQEIPDAESGNEDQEPEQPGRRPLSRIATENWDEAASAVAEAMDEIKLFRKWSADAVEVSDISLMTLFIRQLSMATENCYEAASAVAEAMDEIKLFRKWSAGAVQVSDISLMDDIAVKEKYAKFLQHSAGRYQVKHFP